ncbi:MAG TPA: GtrA family protein [Actinomadura sp.]|nr:GtrA family protein [Actinomadura sp.]
MSFVVNLNRRFVRIAHELAKFGSVGALAFVITIGLGNLLHTGLGMGPLTSNGIATTIATTFSYFANRHWTFRHRDRTGLGREYALFFGLNGIGLVITEIFIGFTHYVLGQHGAIAYNSSLIIGTAVATLFRFWSYKKWVFPPAAAPRAGLAAAPPGGGSPDTTGAPAHPQGDHVPPTPADHADRAGDTGAHGHRPPGHAPEQGPAAEPGQTELRQVTRAR